MLNGRQPCRRRGSSEQARSRSHIQEIIRREALRTAFQPIRCLASCQVVGAEALTRFDTPNGTGPEHWFSEATRVGLGAHLELAALAVALQAAADLPAKIYLSLNISPGTSVDVTLPGLLENSGLELSRMVLEITEQARVDDYEVLNAALAPLRRRGLRIAVDDAGSGYASLRHVLMLRPDIIKLDRSLISGIDTDIAKYALGEAVALFAHRTEATVVAEGIETQAELQTLKGLGMISGQGYLLGHPTANAEDWATWSEETAERMIAAGSTQT